MTQPVTTDETDYSWREERSAADGALSGGVVFAATVMIVVGIFQALQGLAAIIEDNFFVVVDDYAYELDVTTWGWIHLVVGIVVAIGGFALFAGRQWARVVAIVLAVSAAISNFFFIPHFPVWSLLMIGLALWVIWALTRPDVFERV